MELIIIYNLFVTVAKIEDLAQCIRYNNIYACQSEVRRTPNTNVREVVAAPRRNAPCSTHMDRAPLYGHRNLLRYTDSGGKSKYSVTGNFYRR